MAAAILLCSDLTRDKIPFFLEQAENGKRKNAIEEKYENVSWLADYWGSIFCFFYLCTYLSYQPTKSASA